MTRKKRDLIVLAAIAAAYFSTYDQPQARPSAGAKAPKKLTQAHHKEK